MHTEQFTVKNVKCGGCVSNIKNGLQGMSGISEVDVEIAGGKVTVTGENLDRTSIETKLGELGYPAINN